MGMSVTMHERPGSTTPDHGIQIYVRAKESNHPLCAMINHCT